MPALSVRAVSIAETRALRHAVLRPHETLAQLAQGEPPDAFAAGGFLDGELVAVGFIGPDGPEGSWRVRGMAAAPQRRRSGAGSGVLAALLRHALTNGATRVWCNARTPARSLYLRAGFRVCSEEFELPDVGPHVVMEYLPSAGTR